MVIINGTVIVIIMVLLMDCLSKWHNKLINTIAQMAHAMILMASNDPINGRDVSI